MSPSLRNFLTGLIDYAGLFPPAKLPLDEAVHNYVRYLREPEGWMLGRFVCPAARLHELAAYADEVFPAGTTLRLAVVGRGGDTEDQFIDGLRADREALTTFRKLYPKRISADVLELRLPMVTRTWTDRANFLKLFSRAADLWEGIRCTLFYESAGSDDWRAAGPAMIGPLAEENSLGTHASGWSAGVKLRCGGLVPSAVPSPEQVAFTLVTCRDKGVPLKCTAGLHHPLRRYDPELGTKTHGFLNVFAAGILSYTSKLSEDAVRAVLEDEDPASFVFEEQGFRWKDRHAWTDEIGLLRRHSVISFGSCSFDEPRAELRSMGLL